MQSNRIKILHVTYDMNIGGTEQVIRNLIEGLDPEKFENEVLCIDGAIGPWGKQLEAQGFKHHCMARKPGFDLKLIFAINKLIKTQRIDIIHCHQYTPFTYGWFGSLFTGKPVFFTEHGRFYPDYSSPKRRLINPVMQLKTAAITAISKATKDALVTYEFLNPNKIEVIYNGIKDLFGTIDPDAQSELRNQLEIEKDDLVFGTISRLDPIKNQEMMLKAFKEASKDIPNIKLVIVGDGPLRTELETLSQDLKLTDRVIFTGFQSNPKDYLSIMDVFLLPSLSEGTSMTLLEAMSFSKPTIATAVGGTPEIIEHQQTGILIENQNKNQLVEAIVELTTNPSKRKSLGEQARLSYEHRFTLKAMTEQYEDLYTRQNVDHC